MNKGRNLFTQLLAYQMDHVLLSVNYSLHRRDKKLCLSIRLASLIISAYISLPILPALLPRCSIMGRCKNPASHMLISRTRHGAVPHSKFFGRWRALTTNRCQLNPYYTVRNPGRISLSVGDENDAGDQD